jgi:gluconokinase
MNQVPDTIVVMGVCGVGKSAVGSALAGAWGGVFDDADAFHSDEARAKMGAGRALSDEDRWPWLRRLRERILEVRAAGMGPHVLACSALRVVYREILRGEDAEGRLAFVLLDGERDLIAQRMAGRQGHYMPSSLLDSQLAILERSADLVVVGVDADLEVVVRRVMAAFGEGGDVR